LIASQAPSSHAPLPALAPIPTHSAYVSIRQHTSAYVSIRQHTSAYVSIRPKKKKTVVVLLYVCPHT
jgi:hypothetical protein